MLLCRTLRMVGLAGAALGLSACGTAPVLNELPNAPSLRGLSQVGSRTAWVSGSQSSVAVSRDAGRTWISRAPQLSADDVLDFRDIEAFSADEVVLMSAGPGGASRVFRTENGGISWEICATNQEPEGFWDGIAFWNRDRGLLVGDPVDGRLTVLRTEDGGRHWTPVPVAGLPEAIDGEYAFAASGTSLAVAGADLAWIATGGSVARVYRSTDGGHSWQVQASPLSAGTAGSGIFSIAFRDAQNGVLVGGDYELENQVLTIAARTTDGGLSWQAAETMPAGYRSGVSWHPRRKQWIAVGPTGTDVSTDGLHWAPFSTALPGFHAVDGNWMSGAQGSTAHLR
ncbi:MAG: oxidoreductase [Planctomycetota bacterium]|nr:oxidoreductase [Planctomycetota bacterium]MDA1113722.1 oxidoreductase [Planctomycetota bacterium]